MDDKAGPALCQGCKLLSSAGQGLMGLIRSSPSIDILTMSFASRFIFIRSIIRISLLSYVRKKYCFALRSIADVQSV